jgi:polyisoprenoid-binding protein YceI
MKLLRFPLAIAAVAVITIAVSIALLTAVPNASAQTPFKASSKSVMTLNGTSTLHDWTMNARGFTTAAMITLGGDNQITAINALNLTLPVTNLKGEKESMNENAWEALNYDDHKNIVFKLTSATVTPAAGKYTIAAIGNLTISGVTKAITMNVTAQVNADGSINCTGKLPIKLSTFNIERPSFMFGTMSVGDAMTLDYSLVLSK